MNLKAVMQLQQDNLIEFVFQAKGYRQSSVAVMEVTCSFKKLVGGIFASDKRYEREDIVPLSSCNKDVSGHTCSVGITDVHSEVGLVLVHASIFALPHNISTGTICPAHRSSLGIGWRRGANRCRVPPGLSEHTAKGKARKADRGIGKLESRAIL